MRVFVLTFVFLGIVGIVIAGNGRGHGGTTDDDDDNDSYGDSHWCKPATTVFNTRNGFQVRSAGNWSQSISYLLPLDPSQPGVFTYVGGAQYYQTNSYDSRNCQFVSVQAWPSCTGPASPFPSGLYLQTVLQKIIIDRSNPTALQQYNVVYATPAVPVVTGFPAASWTSVGVTPYSIANTVLALDSSGHPTDQVLYLESIEVLPDGNRRYLPATSSSTTFTAIAPFVSEKIVNLPDAYAASVSAYIHGSVPLTYFRSCDSGASWVISNCNQCGVGHVSCAACPGSVAPQCVSSYYVPFADSNNPCV